MLADKFFVVPVQAYTFGRSPLFLLFFKNKLAAYAAHVTIGKVGHELPDGVGSERLTRVAKNDRFISCRLDKLVDGRHFSLAPRPFDQMDPRVVEAADDPGRFVGGTVRADEDLRFSLG